MKCLGKSGLSRRDAGFYMARCSASRLSPKRPAFGPNNRRNLEARGTRRHTCRAVPPHPVIPADLDRLGTLLEYGTGIDLHIDRLLACDAAQAEGPYAGRMAPNAAFGLAALGGALNLFPGSGWRRRAAGWLALLVVFEAVLALLGYLHGTRSLYQVARALRLAQYTASGLLLLSVGTLVAWPQGTALEVLVRRTAGGLLARRVLPPILALP